MSAVNHIFLSLGSNMERRELYILKAMELLEQQAGKIIRFSSVYETESWGFSSEIPFLNNVLEMETALTPIKLLHTTQYIEKVIGREKKGKPYASRQIDIDILFFNDLIVLEKELQIPHPLIHKRRFVLEPLAEIAEDFFHPLLKQNIKTLLTGCNDKLMVKRLKNDLVHAI